MQGTLVNSTRKVSWNLSSYKSITLANKKQKRCADFTRSRIGVSYLSERDGRFGRRLCFLFLLLFTTLMGTGFYFACFLVSFQWLGHLDQPQCYKT